MVRYGVSVPFKDGFLPVMSVGSEDEAAGLLAAACRMDRETHEYIAEELVAEQTLENLAAFGERLKRVHAERFAGTARCACVEQPLRGLGAVLAAEGAAPSKRRASP